MELVVERGRRVSVEELATTKLLAHARQQAVRRKLDDILIVDCDAHHYETRTTARFFPLWRTMCSGKSRYRGVLRADTTSCRAKPASLRTWAAG